jgi:hypothetical protein
MESTVESCGYDEIVDFAMSERFGIDWKRMNTRRAVSFITIMRAQQERRDHEARKSEYGKR